MAYSGMTTTALKRWATILWAALLPYYQPFSIAAMPMLGAGNFVQVLNSQSFRGSIANSLMLGAAAATLVTALEIGAVSLAVNLAATALTPHPKTGSAAAGSVAQPFKQQFSQDAR